jgi:hypothetical protein
MKGVVPAAQWHLIRHLHVSTLILTPAAWWTHNSTFPPEGLARWTDGCRAVRGMRGLRSLYFDIIVWHTIDQEDASAVDDESLIEILKPLQELDAPEFVVEMNFGIPEKVERVIGERRFRFVVRERPFDRVLSPV